MEFGARSLNHTQPARPKGSFPDKVPGKHRWTMVATYAVSADALKLAHRQTVDADSPILDTENLVYLAAGCIDCEQVWPAPEPCTAHYGGFDR
jgi:hypothetical protein